MLKQRLQQKLLQKLSPQQIQMIKLLEIPALQLEQRIKKELEENPLLEEGSDDEKTPAEKTEEENEEEENSTEDKNEDEFTLEDYMDEDDIPEYKLSVSNVSPDDRSEEIPFSVGATFHEHLQSQLGL